MKIIFTGGGTQGHVAPCIAVAEQFIKRKNAEVLFVGRRDGEENKSIVEHGFPFIPIDIKSLASCHTAEKLRYPVMLMQAKNKAKKILNDFQPDAVFSSGGYVSYPIVCAAADLKTPIYIHESNAIAGRATKMQARHARCIFLGMEGSEDAFPHARKTLFTSTPVKEDFFRYTKAQARRLLGIGNEFMLLSLGGSLGAQRLNEVLLELMDTYSNSSGMYHIHSCGERYFNLIDEKYRVFSNSKGKCRAVPYINDMPLYMKAADIVVSRAGASTISEIRASGCCSILIPSPNVKNNHQYHNARSLERCDGAILLNENNLSSSALIKQIERLRNNAALRINIAKKAYLPIIKSAASVIVDAIIADCMQKEGL